MSDEYQVEGLDLIKHDVPTMPGFEGCEALTFSTPSGARLTVAKDSMGVQICNDGQFFPGFVDYRTLEAAVDYLRANTEDAIAFFDNVARQERMEKI